jgi:hypothetical protein
VPEVEGFKVCVAKDAKRSFPGDVDSPVAKPPSPPSGNPAEPGTTPPGGATPVSPTSEEETNWTLILSAAGSIFVLIAIIAFIMIKRKKGNAFE